MTVKDNTLHQSKHIVSTAIGGNFSVLTKSGCTYRIKRICMYVLNSTVIGIFSKFKKQTITTLADVEGITIFTTVLGNNHYNENFDIKVDELNVYIGATAITVDIHVWYDRITNN